MMGPVAAYLPGNRLHLQHGPIDLIIGADGDRDVAFAAAQGRFSSILDELVAELAALRLPMGADVARPMGAIARRMDRATRPLSDHFVTRMAAVAGAVADTILQSMVQAAPLTRAYVNNGGDIALHLAKNQSLTLAISGHYGAQLGRATIHHSDRVRGIATSGRHGRSHSLGIACSVTVLAQNAASADGAATLIANAVDLPDHPAIIRRPACDLDDMSDLGAQPVVTRCGPLSLHDIETALDHGHRRAAEYVRTGQISAAALFLQGQSCVLNPDALTLTNRIPAHA